jgi:anti-sigma B factor antagonist
LRFRDYYLTDGRASDGTYRVGAGGELDLAAQEELSASLRRAEQSGAMTLELDFTQVTFIDSTAIKALAVAGREFLARGGSVDLAVGNENVFRIFEITGLDRFFDVSIQPELEQPVS